MGLVWLRSVGGCFDNRTWLTCLSVICFAVNLLDLISHQTKKDTPSLCAAHGCMSEDLLTRNGTKPL